MDMITLALLPDLQKEFLLLVLPIPSKASVLANMALYSASVRIGSHDANASRTLFISSTFFWSDFGTASECVLHSGCCSWG
jgi:hypothetical protein